MRTDDKTHTVRVPNFKTTKFTLWEFKEAEEVTSTIVQNLKIVLITAVETCMLGRKCRLICIVFVLCFYCICTESLIAFSL